MMKYDETRVHYHKTGEEEAAYKYWLHNMQMIGEKAMRYLMDQYGSAKQIYLLSEYELYEKLILIGYKEKVLHKKLEEYMEAKKNWQIWEQYERLAKQQIHFVSRYDKEYPQKLLQISSPPLMLYYKGSLPKETTPSLAIIGARECSAYGSFLAESFGSCAGKCQINVVSGMARGIDGIAQNAALKAGGATYSVLGCGVDICYPNSNKLLYEQLCTEGGVLSPFLPGTTPKRQFFPFRNSIVAGLSDAVLVIEAKQHSGTSITVDMALEQGKDVYAVPGRLTDRLSDGCNMLLRAGAGIALSPEDLMAEIKLLSNRKESPVSRSPHTKIHKKRLPTFQKSPFP